MSCARPLEALDMRYTMPIPPSQQSPTGILNILRSKGAGDLCYAISEDDELNGKELELDGALAAVAGRGMGTFLSCVKGMLDYFVDEDQRLILERRAEH